MQEPDTPLLPFDAHRPEPLIFTRADKDLLELILTDQELTRLHQAEQGEALCLACEQPMYGIVMIAPEYEGLTLVCVGCGWCEY